jgi:leucyl-tRNA synthetase
LLSPVIPHLCEEVWELTGHDDFITSARWPICDETVVNEMNEFKWNLLSDLGDDIREIIKVARITSPKRIRIYSAAGWKFRLAALFKQEFAKTKDRGQIMKTLMSTDLKRYGKQVNRILGKYLNDPALAPYVDMGLDGEFSFLNEAALILESGFNCAIEFYKEEDSHEKKAAGALPGRPAIIID